ncbi:MAG: zf-HC2 domain-containing protein [Candidatus Binataceae bacterium]
MAACGEIQHLLGPFEDGELRPRDMEDVAFHVVGCAVCRTALDDYRSLGLALREVALPPRLDGFTRAVMTRIKSERAPLSARLRELWESLGRFGSVVQVVGVATASAALTFVILAPRVSESFHPSAAVPMAIAKQNQTLQNHPALSPIAQNPIAQARVAQNRMGLSPAAPLMTASTAAADPSGATDVAEAIAARDSQELVSELGAGSGPSVAVWNEPRTGTTVVWVPDQQP